MARLCARADGNNTSASTWAVIDSASFSESESSNMTAPTAYSTAYTQFTPGAITIDGIGLRVNARSGTTGTFSVELYNHTAGASVAGTEVTVNCSDFVDASAGTIIDGGWMFFKFGASVTLLAANNYTVRFKTSTSSQIILYSSTTSNPSRFLRTTTTAAPAAGDDRFIMKEWTSAGTGTNRTVTGDDTSNTDYGSGATSFVNPALSVSNGGSYISGTSASTTYLHKISGNVVIYNGGIVRIGTSGGRMPTTSSATWTFDCVSNADFGIDVRRKGEFSCYGEQKQRWTTLTSDEAAASTSIQVTSTSGWKNSDTLLFAPTGTSNTQAETKTVSTVDSGTQVTLSAGLTNAHTGTGDVIGEVGNLTSNVTIIGTSTTVGTFINYRDSSIGYLDNITLQYYGSSTTDRRGLQIQHVLVSALNSVTVNSCAFRDAASVSATVGTTATQCHYFYINNNVIYWPNFNGTALSATGGNGTPTFTVDGNLVVGVGSGTGISQNLRTSVTATCNNNRVAGLTTGVISSSSAAVDQVSNMSGLKVHSNTTGLTATSSTRKTLTSCDFVSNGNGVTSIAGLMTFDSCNFYGNSTAGVFPTAQAAGPGYAVFNNCTFRGRTSFNQPAGLSITSNNSTSYHSLIFNSCTFGSSIAHTTADIIHTGISNGRLIFNNTTLASSTEFSGSLPGTLEESGIIGVQRKDGSAGSHAAYIKNATLTPDTSIFRTASPSTRIAPTLATTGWTTALPETSMEAFVPSGTTCTPTVYVRESEAGDGAAYNGVRVKLYVKANVAAGITSDTLLDTATAASDGAWEALTGTTTAVTDDAVLEFYVTGDGTTGWVNVDDYSYTTA